LLKNFSLIETCYLFICQQTAKRGGGGGGYTRAYNLSPELAAVMGTEKMARHEVVRKMWSIIKEKNLYVSHLCFANCSMSHDLFSGPQEQAVRYLQR
jgi:SWIB/MDM2 domain